MEQKRVGEEPKLRVCPEVVNDKGRFQPARDAPLFKSGLAPDRIGLPYGAMQQKPASSRFFTEDLGRGRGIEAAIFPYLKLIGMALLARERGRLQ
ncbi:MAG TPA: hypothetical protein VGC13_26520 [Longimicrobium sp.]|uniref:hypothetical protein n=1 Tax=Longimicrobium sp. TaxID=2029185 RepID=UPI002ED82D95